MCDRSASWLCRASSLEFDFGYKTIFRSDGSKIQTRLFSHSIFHVDCISGLGFTNEAWEDALCARLHSRGILVILLGVTICVADNDSHASVFINGKICKDPKLATANDFYFSGLNVSGNAVPLVGITTTIVDVNNMPGLNKKAT